MPPTATWANSITLLWLGGIVTVVEVLVEVVVVGGLVVVVVVGGLVVVVLVDEVVLVVEVLVVVIVDAVVVARRQMLAETGRRHQALL